MAQIEELDPNGVIQHTYLNASENPAHYAADQADRQAVTVKFLYEQPDLTGYFWSHRKAEYGLDPWTEIQGIDRERDAPWYWLDYDRVGSVKVRGDHEVFVSRKQLLKVTGIATTPGGRFNRA